MLWKEKIDENNDTSKKRLLYDLKSFPVALLTTPTRVIGERSFSRRGRGTMEHKGLLLDLHDSENQAVVYAFEGLIYQLECIQ